MFSSNQSRMIVIDDSTPIQKIFRIALSKYPIEIVICNSLQEAMLASNISPAILLIVDAHLPDIQSPLDIVGLQEKNNHAPVILLVGTHESIDLNPFKSVGISHILKKPFEIQDLIREMQAIVGTDVFQERSEPTHAAPIRLNLDEMNIPPPPNMRPSFSGPAEVSMDFPFSMQTSSDLMQPPPPPIISVDPMFNADHSRKGRRAFSEPSPADLPVKDVDDSKHQLDLTAEKNKIEELRKSVEEFLLNDAPVIVRKAVEKYCETHFQELARDILTSEIRRLAEERSRILSN